MNLLVLCSQLLEVPYFSFDIVALITPSLGVRWGFGLILGHVWYTRMGSGNVYLISFFIHSHVDNLSEDGNGIKNDSKGNDPFSCLDNLSKDEME